MIFFGSYIDPQYILRECLTISSDVYSYGVVLLELITGQKPIDSTREVGHNLVEWVKTSGFSSFVSFCTCSEEVPLRNIM
ncbi:protein kinase, partial [Streptococcus pseudopneumoniae]